jgi:hypothetical protein
MMRLSIERDIVVLDEIHCSEHCPFYYTNSPSCVDIDLEIDSEDKPLRTLECVNNSYEI